MQTSIARFLFERRVWLKRLIFIRHPVILHLADCKLYVRLDDWASGARIAVKRTYEAHVTHAMRPLLRPGMVVVDIGANIGYYTLLAASRVGNTGKVLAFEPARANTALIHASLEVNGFTQVIVHPYAVADEERIVGFQADESNGVINPHTPATSPQQVRAVCLDTFLAEEPRLDLVKLDIEGAEGLALRGMQHLIQQHRPLIFSELNWNALRRVSRMEPEEYLDLLRAPGYDLFIIPRRGNVSAAPWSNAHILDYCHTSGERDHIDLLARPCASA